MPTHTLAGIRKEFYGNPSTRFVSNFTFRQFLRNPCLMGCPTATQPSVPLPHLLCPLLIGTYGWNIQFNAQKTAGSSVAMRLSLMIRGNPLPPYESAVVIDPQIIATVRVRRCHTHSCGRTGSQTHMSCGTLHEWPPRKVPRRWCRRSRCHWVLETHPAARRRRFCPD